MKSAVLVALQVMALAACVAILVKFRSPVALGVSFAIAGQLLFLLMRRAARPLALRMRKRHFDRQRTAGS